MALSTTRTIARGVERDASTDIGNRPTPDNRDPCPQRSRPQTTRFVRRVVRSHFLSGYSAERMRAFAVIGVILYPAHRLTDGRTPKAKRVDKKAATLPWREGRRAKKHHGKRLKKTQG